MNQSRKVFPDEPTRLNPGAPAAVSGGGRVTASRGTVKLFGCLAHDDDRREVEKRIQSTGAHDIIQEIDVAGTEDQDDCEDTMIAASAGEALLPYLDLADDTVTIHVEGGWVELEGEVEDYQLRQTVDRVLRDLHGVQGLTNSLNVRSDVSVEQLKTQVSQALDRVARASAVV